MLLVPLGGGRGAGSWKAPLSPVSSSFPASQLVLQPLDPPHGASWSAGKNVGSREWFRARSWALLLRSCLTQGVQFVCVCIRNEVEATGNVKSAPVVDPDTGNLSVLSQMEAADENSSF